MRKHAKKGIKDNRFSESFRKKSPSPNTRIAFESIKISNFSRVTCPQTPLEAPTLGAQVICR